MTTFENVKFTKDGNTLYVDTIRVTENYTNAVKVIKVPTLDETPEDPMVINLNKMEDRFTIVGHLTNGKMDASETWATAKEKKDGFKSMISKGSTVTMVYEGDTYSLAIDKFQITHNANDNTDSVDGEVVYDVTISGVSGSDVV